MIESATELLNAVRELDTLSKQLTETERGLERVEDQVDDFIGDYESAMWDESQSDPDVKWPPERVRLAQAHRALDRDLYNRYRALKRSRARLKQRLSDLKEIVSAHRSLVSAAKTELEATEGPQPAWSGR